MKKTQKCCGKSALRSGEAKGESLDPSPVVLSDQDESFTAILVAILSGLLFGFLLVLVIQQYYKPDIVPLIAEAKSLVTPHAAGCLAPEPVERLQYLGCMLLVPIFLCSFYFCFERRRIQFSEIMKKRIGFSANVLLFAVSAFAPIYVYAALANSDGRFLYVRSGVLFSNLWLYALVIYPVLALLAVYSYRPWVLWAGRALLIPLSLFVAVTAFFAAIFNSDGISPWAYHINPVIYPVAQVLSSKTLLVNCSPLYGLYPHFIEPIFRVIPLSIYTFTVLMGGLLLVCLFSVWGFLRKLVKNEIILYAGLIAAVFYSHIGVKMLLSVIRPDPYFQYAPIRMLFPCLLLFSSMAYLRDIGGRWVYGINFCIAGLAILWNPDTGAVVFGAWVLLLIYTELFGRSFTVSMGSILRHVAMAILVLAVVYAGFGVFALLRSGAWPDWGMTQKYYKLFSYYGYFMLPMKGLPHVWGVLVVLYVTSMAISIHGLFRGGDRNFYGSLFLLTILGVGLFAYYQGRSHDFCLMPLLYLPILILTVFVDRVFSAVMRRDEKYYKLMPIAGLCFFYVLVRCRLLL